MDTFGDLQTWHGLLKQPMIPYTYGSSFNAVDIHNKLALGLAAGPREARIISPPEAPSFAPGGG
jgi:hypothetical protein